MEMLKKGMVDYHGRVTLPIEFIEAHGWEPMSVVEIYQDNGTLVIKLVENQAKPESNTQRDDVKFKRPSWLSDPMPLGGGAGPCP